MKRLAEAPRDAVSEMLERLTGVDDLMIRRLAQAWTLKEDAMTSFGAEYLEAIDAPVFGGLKYMDPRNGLVYIDGEFYYQP